MSDKITQCLEEEYSFCAAYLWRRAARWKPVMIYLRGPAGVPFLVGPFLWAIGLWRFARPPRRLADCASLSLEHAVVTLTSCSLGSYGMGGPGFVGFRVRPLSGPDLWVVFTVWAAAGWLTVDGALLEEGYSPDERSDPSQRFSPLASLLGARLTAIGLSAESAEFTFVQDGATHNLCLQRDSSHLPVHRGSKQPRVLSLTEDLRDSVIVSRKGDLWLND